MIVNGKPELGLQQHQQEAYTAITNAYKTRNKASVVIPTGCGKSFISLQLMIDNKDKNILFMAPTNAIKDQMYKYIAKYIADEVPTNERPAKMIAKEQFPNLKIVLYPSLLRMKNEIIEKLNPDVIIMDELHRTGADKWGQKIDALITSNPSAKILGLTATPDRMDDKNIVDELFSGNIDYELTLVEAIQKGIVQAPNYVKCDYSLKDSLENVKTAMEQCSNPQIKKEIQDRYDKMRRIVEHAQGIPELFSKNMSKKDGKYIVFCKDKQHMDELIEQSAEWFKDIDTKPEIYSVYSGKGYSEKTNKNTIKNFESSTSKHLKLLFSVDMLNEGLHVEDISGVIMLRPTDSRIIYLQQLGRALSSDTSREKTIVFDLVNNYLKNNLDAEINQKQDTMLNERKNKNENTEQSLSSKEKDIDIFRIQGETKEFLELLEEINQFQNQNVFLGNAQKIEEWVNKNNRKKLPSTKSTNEEEKKLGLALRTIKLKIVRPYEKLKTIDEKNEFKNSTPNFDEIMKILNNLKDLERPTVLKNAYDIQLWINSHEEPTLPSQRSKDKEEKRLATAYNTIKQDIIKPFMLLNNEEQKKYLIKRPEIKELISVIDSIDFKVGKNNKFKKPQSLINTLKIKDFVDKNNKYPTSCSSDSEEKKLGMALSEIRRRIIKPYIDMEENEKNSYIDEHPYASQIIDSISNMDLIYGTKKQKELAILIKQDLEKRQLLEEAKKLEKKYEIQLANSKDKKLETRKEDIGVDFDEQ